MKKSKTNNQIVIIEFNLNHTISSSSAVGGCGQSDAFHILQAFIKVAKQKKQLYNNINK